MHHHIVFYDGECALCSRAVRFLKKRDKRGVFTYEPLQGKVARETFDKPPSLDTLILYEDHKRPLYYGKGALRILWHLGGLWRFWGVLSFLPSFLADGVYRLIAKNRHLFS